MFTASVFKELIFPLFDEIKNCLIFIPLKTTKEVDFAEDLKNMLLNCGLSPESFVGAVNCLNNSRKTIYSESFATLSENLNYFLELEHVSMRFSIKNFSNTFFFW